MQFNSFMNDPANWMTEGRYGALSEINIVPFNEFSTDRSYRNFLNMVMDETPLLFIVNQNTSQQDFRLHYRSQPSSILFPEQFARFECVTYIEEYHVPLTYELAHSYFECTRTCLKCYVMRDGVAHAMFSDSDSDSDNTQVSHRRSHRDHRRSFYIRHQNYMYLHYDLNEEDWYWCRNCFKPLFKTWAFMEGNRSDQIYPDNGGILQSYISRNASYHLFPTAITDSARVSCYGKHGLYVFSVG